MLREIQFIFSQATGTASHFPSCIGNARNERLRCKRFFFRGAMQAMQGKLINRGDLFFLYHARCISFFFCIAPTRFPDVLNRVK